MMFEVKESWRVFRQQGKIWDIVIAIVGLLAIIFFAIATAMKTQEKDFVLALILFFGIGAGASLIIENIWRLEKKQWREMVDRKKFDFWRVYGWIVLAIHLCLAIYLVSSLIKSLGPVANAPDGLGALAIFSFSFIFLILEFTLTLVCLGLVILATLNKFKMTCNFLLTMFLIYSFSSLADMIISGYGK